MVVTFTFWRLGKVKSWDAFFYHGAVFWRTDWSAAGCKGTQEGDQTRLLIIVTVPGSSGVGVAFIAE